MPGDYTFMVKGSNNDEVWNEIPVTLRIHVKPPFWKTWWAIAIYIFILSLFIYIVLKIRDERIHIKNQLKFEQLAREKEHELNESNIQFFTNISHEFRTPLSLIIAPLESMISLAGAKIKDQLIVIYRNAERLLQLTNNLLDFRKLEDGKLILQVQKGDLLNLLNEVSTFFKITAKSRNIDFDIESSASSVCGWFDHEKLETILLNILSNAFKNTPDNGKIRILVNADPNHQTNEKDFDTEMSYSNLIEISIINSGPGIAPEDLPNIFDKFYQTKSSGSKNKGTGIGLALTKGLVELHRGKIWVNSVPDVETCFAFSLPIGKMHLKRMKLYMNRKTLLKRPSLKTSNM
ncbi:MAG: hypothetical protein HC906_13485 [Bacteroidales bacterium]|nr:hypothetical protein [Bacteroidales bacterium]